MELSPGAAELLLAAERDIEPELRPHGDYGTIVDWASKLIGAVARVAGILHIAEHQGGTTYPISAETMTAAGMIGNYFVAHALAAFDAMGIDPVIEDARYILDWIRRTRVEWFSRRDAHRGCQRFKKAGDLAAPLDLLEDHGYISRRPDPDRTGGRPPAPNYDVNPLIFDT